jgi:hypothetical protein
MKHCAPRDPQRVPICFDMFHDMFTICLFISPDSDGHLDGHRYRTHRICFTICLFISPVCFTIPTLFHGMFHGMFVY